MPYLNIAPEFPEHPKTKRLIAKVGDNAITFLLKLWCFAAKFHPDDGSLSQYSQTEIESFAGWLGEPGMFYKSCVEVGFIDEKDTKKKFQIFLHDWRKHQGHLKAFRQKAEAAAKARWAKTAQTTKKQRVMRNAPSMPQACPKQCSNDAQAMLESTPSNAPTALTSLTVLDKKNEEGTHPKSKSEYQQVVDDWFDQYEKKYRHKPRMDAADGKALKALISEVGLAEVLEVNWAYFQYPDSWRDEHGASIKNMCRAETVNSVNQWRSGKGGDRF